MSTISNSDDHWYGSPMANAGTPVKLSRKQRRQRNREARRLAQGSSKKPLDRSTIPEIEVFVRYVSDFLFIFDLSD